MAILSFPQSLCLLYMANLHYYVTHTHILIASPLVCFANHSQVEHVSAYRQTRLEFIAIAAVSLVPRLRPPPPQAVE